jgi:tetratricopeptide (TPR) repeat protein/opacity protein-like surface antigen
VRTPYTVAGVRGTEFYIRVADEQTRMTIYTGQVVASNPSGSLSLTGGQSAVVEKGKAPVLQTVARPRDAVQWALYYPPVLYAQPDQLKSGVDWERQVGASWEAYLQGDLQKAFDAIESVPEGIREPDFFTYRASLLLAVGEVEAASADIERALRLNADDSDALALQTMIAIVQNDKDKALRFARKAVTSAPESATAQIALSYAQQARFDLDGARASLTKAVQLEPANALAWARLAELHASFGDLDKSLQAAGQAVDLEPNLARTQTVLGFAHLARVDIAKAMASFEKAIALDQAAPLPRLGMGLAIIRDGNVSAGSHELEIAASLDPNNALIRSYLGKAYYEDKRGALDEREFDVAKQLDPNDPTPWFYSAIAKQSTNRPVEALRDMQKAIELNDNRAVYRSKLLLDSDLAARSASQARIYSDLGFQQLALVEGWKSVNTDPSNYSAHRFLADTYAALPRHEVARVSELLQSQLLQPLNMTPIQPRLSESNLFLMSAGGPGTLSFNEFNPLFNRNGINLQASGLAGENDTWAGEGVVAGIYQQLSFSIGGSHFETDGWRTNSDQRDDIVNAFVQAELAPDISMQFEYRYRDIETGDLTLNFFPDDVLPNLRTEGETHTYRLGLRYALASNSTLLASLMYQRRDTLAGDEPPFAVSLAIEEPNLEGYSGELQHLFRSRFINITSGLGHFSVHREQVLTIDFGFPPPLVDIADLDAEHTNLYLYSYINVLRNVTFTLGASGDFFNTDNSTATASRDQFNPKFGVTWNVLPSTTIRAAAFRTFKRTLLTNQTLEPTQVAGFNQFFDDVESTDAWRYGIGVDHRFSQAIAGGVEFSRRDLEVPLPVTDLNTGLTRVERDDWTEDLVRAYLFWTPHKWLALSTEYQYEYFDRVEDFGFGLRKANTHRVPLGLRFFHPSGLGLGLKATYFNQDGEFQRRDALCCESGTSDFWVVDAALNYRFPKRYGLMTIGASNLFDEAFKYQETDFNNPSILPDRVFFARVTLALP